jgi:hypothetical protein
MRAPFTLRRSLMLAIGAIGVSVMALLPAAPALADPPPVCGATVTTNVTLAADLVCAGDALVIGADRIVFQAPTSA